MEGDAAAPLHAVEAVRSVGDLRNIAMEYVAQGAYADAIPVLRRALQEAPARWELTWHLHYLLGQCLRFTDDANGSLRHLREAARLNPTDPPVWLALGIALQILKQYDDAIHAFAKALDLDPDYAHAYNSLAVTQKRMGELEKAQHNYDVALLAHMRRFVKELVNDRGSRIYRHQDTRGQLWTGYAVQGMMFSAVSDGDVDRVAFPNGEQAAEEEHTGRHGGLYFVDSVSPAGERVRFFLPNYFNTFREVCCRDRFYANVLRNRGAVLDLLGRAEEARQHFDEADEFAEMR